MTCLREIQIASLEIGEPEPEGRQLFARKAFKQALPEVSKVRLEQTLYAEHPGLQPLIRNLQGGKTLQTVQSLSFLWKFDSLENPVEKTAEVANQLVDAGFFERRGQEYWIPFLYRDALELVQGAEI